MIELQTSVRIARPIEDVYRYALDADHGQTVLRLDAEVELEGVAGLLGPLAGRAVKRGVDDNFATLKRLLEGDGRRHDRAGRMKACAADEARRLRRARRIGPRRAGR